MMGALFKVLKVKTRSKDPLSIKVEQLIYFPRTLEENWLDKIFSGLGCNLSSWVKSLISTELHLLIAFLVILLIYYCLKKELTNKPAANRMIIQTVAKKQNLSDLVTTFPP